METTRSRHEIRAEQQVNDVIRAHPETVVVFDSFGIDSCCGGDVSLREAAARDGAELAALVTALNGISVTAA